MDQLKITISGITNVFVGNITIRTERKNRIDSNFSNVGGIYVGTILHKLDPNKVNPMYIYITGEGGPCTCKVLNESKNIVYGFETRDLSRDGGVNFIFYI